MTRARRVNYRAGDRARESKAADSIQEAQRAMVRTLGVELEQERAGQAIKHVRGRRQFRRRP